MKAVKNWFARRGALPLTAYLLALAVWVVLGAAHCGSDALAKAQGRLTETTLGVNDWQLVGLAQDGGTLATLDGDPQMIVEDVSGQVVRTLSYTVQFDGEAARITVPTGASTPRALAMGGMFTRCRAQVWRRCALTPAARRTARP